MFASVGDLQVSYEVTGSGAPLLLVAGTAYSGSTWYPALLQDLARDHTVVTYDHRGTGRTTGPTGAFSTRDLAADAVGLLDALGLGRAHVLGHSMGGRVAQWMAIDAPERVRSLILAATGPGPLPGSQGHTAGVPVRVAAGMVEHGYKEFLRRTQRETFLTERAPAELVEWLLEAFWESRPSVTDYFQHVAARQQHDTVALLDRIVQPALCLVGSEDTTRHGTGSHVEQSEYLAAHLPDAVLEVLPGLKHGYLWEAPELTAQHIREWTGRH